LNRLEFQLQLCHYSS